MSYLVRIYCDECFGGHTYVCLQQHPDLRSEVFESILAANTRGAFAVVAPLFLFPGVHRDEQVANPLMCDAADVPPAWTLPQQADEFRVSMTLWVKRHPSEPLRFLTL